MSKYSNSRLRLYIINFSVRALTNVSGRLASCFLSSTTPLMATPFGNTVLVSMWAFACASVVLHTPIASKFSRAKPVGSITPWHWLQVALLRCCSSRARTVFGGSPVFCDRSVAVSGGGGEGGVPISLSSTHAPRNTGDVRSPYDVRISTAALPSRPQRAESAFWASVTL